MAGGNKFRVGTMLGVGRPQGGRITTVDRNGLQDLILLLNKIKLPDRNILLYLILLLDNTELLNRG